MGWVSREQVLEKLGAIEEKFHARQQKAKEELASLTEMKEHPPVRVRNYGVGTGNCRGDKPPYHSHDRPCNQAPSNRWRYDVLLLGEAEARGHDPCDSCGHRARWAAQQAKQAG